MSLVGEVYTLCGYWALLNRWIDHLRACEDERRTTNGYFATLGKISKYRLFSLQMYSSSSVSG